jgi:hypothetical protein
LKRRPIRCAWVECAEPARILVTFKDDAYGLPAGHRVAFCDESCMRAWVAAVAGANVADVTFIPTKSGG